MFSLGTASLDSFSVAGMIVITDVVGWLVCPSTQLSQMQWAGCAAVLANAIAACICTNARPTPQVSFFQLGVAMVAVLVVWPSLKDMASHAFSTVLQGLAIFLLACSSNWPLVCLAATSATVSISHTIPSSHSLFHACQLARCTNILLAFVLCACITIFPDRLSGQDMYLTASLVVLSHLWTWISHPRSRHSLPVSEFVSQCAMSSIILLLRQVLLPAPRDFPRACVGFVCASNFWCRSTPAIAGLRRRSSPSNN